MTNKKLLAFKRVLYTKIKEIKINGIISISLIGSFLYTKHFQKVNDIDLVIIVKNLNPLSFKKINKIFKQIAKQLSSSKFKVVVENRIGPFKADPQKGKKVVELHLLIYELESWKITRKTVRHDMVNFNKNIIGIPLKKISHISKINEKDLQKDIAIWLNAIIHNSVFSVKFKQLGKKMVSYNANWSVSRVVTKLVTTAIAIYVGGNVMVNIGQAMNGTCSPFYKGLKLIGWTVKTGNCTDFNSASTPNTIIDYSAGTGVLSVVGIIGVASVVLEFVKFR
jgi:hypothetical protein